VSGEEFSDDSDAPDLDAGVWVAHHLPLLAVDRVRGTRRS
jgi:hypothetical protein